VPSLPPPHCIAAASSSSSPSADTALLCAPRACTLRLVAAHSGAVLYERDVPSAEAANATHIGAAWALGERLPPDVLLTLSRFSSDAGDGAAATAGGSAAAVA
jgi:hypothetical protein